ncbi:MAG TPA: DUF177 domain-containing protein [Acidimicrobiales bacterium]|nr:DUF177 domain-containing protein [Acidimicrobiales bacterium]
MSGRRALTVKVADLLRRPGQRRHESLEAVLEGLQVLGCRVPDGSPVHVDVHLESLNEGVVVKGTTEAPWVGECRRCLRPVAARLSSPILEVYEADPTEGETQLLEGGEIDIEPVAREAVLLELPLAPLCRDDCAGLCPRCGVDRNESVCGCVVHEPDPRWAGLEDLELDD